MSICIHFGCGWTRRWVSWGGLRLAPVPVLQPGFTPGEIPDSHPGFSLRVSRTAMLTAPQLRRSVIRQYIRVQTHIQWVEAVIRESAGTLWILGGRRKAANQCPRSTDQRRAISSTTSAARSASNCWMNPWPVSLSTSWLISHHSYETAELP